MKYVRIFWSLSILLLLCLVTACGKEETYGLGKHRTVVFKIDPLKITQSLGRNDYRLDSVCTLSFPDSMKYETTKILAKGNRIYVLDSRVGHTVYVFDCSGKYLFKLSERGRASYEYVGEPKDFFVDNMGNVHVFDYDGQKVLSFTKKGKIFRVFSTGRLFPHSFGLTDNNRYAFCRNDKDEKEMKPALMLCDWNFENPEMLLPAGNVYRFRPSDRTFFSNEKRLSHIPILSDSVLVFKNDSIEKVVRFDFGMEVASRERLDLVTRLATSQEWNRYKGVWCLEEYQETDKLIYLEYIYDGKEREWLYNKQTGRIIHCAQLFKGVSAFSNYYLRGNQIIALVDKETVDELLKLSVNKGFQDNLRQSVPQLDVLIKGEIKAPALFYISVK